MIYYYYYPLWQRKKKIPRLPLRARCGTQLLIDYHIDATKFGYDVAHARSYTTFM